MPDVPLTVTVSKLDLQLFLAAAGVPLESNQTGCAIQHLVKNTTLNTFTVYLSAAVASGKSANVAWFVIG